MSGSAIFSAHWNKIFRKHWAFRAYVAVELLQGSRSHGVPENGNQQWLNIPDIVCSLKKCADKNDLIGGRQIHSYIKKYNLEQNTFLRNWLMYMYGKCGAVDHAVEMFHKAQSKNSFSYDILLSAYVRHGKVKQAMHLFEEMPQRNVVSWTSMVTLCVRHGKLIEAQELFEKMPERNVISWNSLISGYIHHGLLKEAEDLFQKMPQRDLVSWNTMLAGYALNGQLENACILFHEMPHKDVVSWTVLMAAYGECGQIKELIHAFQEMQLEGLKPNKATFLTMVNACANQAALVEGSWVHRCILRSRMASEMTLGNALIDMYGKSGCLDDACSVFEKMEKHNVVSWNTIIAAYAQHGHADRAERHFSKMQAENCIPDDVTIMNILNAYVNVGLVDNGCHCLVSMSKDFKVIPRLGHYTLNVDNHGKVGELDVAEDLIINMPFLADITLWMSLFQSCKLHLDISRATRVAKYIEVAPGNAGTYVSLAHLYAALRH